MIELVVFLGNPGARYAGNRHNAGRMLAARLPFFETLKWGKKFKGLYAEYPGDGRPFRFLMPETFMNLSGESAAKAASFFGIENSAALLVVHDELELPLGTLSLKEGGGLGGHNGLRSLRACFGNADFWRLRIGIGRPDSRTPGRGGQVGSDADIVGWVLSDFSPSEKPALDAALAAGAGLLLEALEKGPEALLPEWRKKAAGGGGRKGPVNTLRKTRPALPDVIVRRCRT
ncbi:MAG: aminoacyl-tRNA hydrolase, partial [Treponema sp.]|nr:aminoacyl-tRNA hydrolase [Treponema sp.]